MDSGGKTYRKGPRGSYVCEGLLHVWDGDGFDAVPVPEAVFDGEP